MEAFASYFVGHMGLKIGAAKYWGHRCSRGVVIIIVVEDVGGHIGDAFMLGKVGLGVVLVDVVGDKSSCHIDGI